MADYFTADTHLGHAKIIVLAKRPFADVTEMDERIISNWNRLVTDADDVWHLGDVSMRNPARFLAKLKGRIHLIKGNHDKFTDAKARQMFHSVHDVKMVTIGKQQIWLSHYAHRVSPKAHYGVWHLYGHSHGTLPDLGNCSIDVGVDARRHYFNASTLEEGKANYRPWTLEEIRALMAARGHQPVDHHGVKEEEL